MYITLNTRRVSIGTDRRDGKQRERKKKKSIAMWCSLCGLKEVYHDEVPLASGPAGQSQPATRQRTQAQEYKNETQERCLAFQLRFRKGTGNG